MELIVFLLIQMVVVNQMIKNNFLLASNPSDKCRGHVTLSVTLFQGL